MLLDASSPEALAASSVIVSAAKGSDYWYGVAFNSLGQPKTVIYLRYSWSWMWYLKQHMGTINDLSQAACGLLIKAGATTVAACVFMVKAYFAKMQSVINQGISAKKCLRFRIPAPPLADISLVRFDLVTCRV
ncbi:hypothetical protein [Phycicoccus sp. Soil802]|uniref:hypothetical protein n=1 Tax=Phycicoccus sp. Soil802 TaxID=1736414 RepID=UPI000702BDC8|nr:hypothetical protein [Phycicoccus sp. Soil802]KRF29938.1 hypothetical protein ASG91_02850 [Phycicoccus sp. Soil802]